MKSSKEILTSILKTAQMGQTGIQSVLGAAMEPSLRAALRSQLREYDAIESEAHTIASSRGWDLREMDPAFRFLAGKITRMKLRRGDSGSRIADMMIQGNTQGMIKSLRDKHRYSGADLQVSTLSQKLLDCEAAGIRQMQPFL